MKKTLFFVFIVLLIFILLFTCVASAGYQWDAYLRIGGGHDYQNDYTYEGHNYDIIDSSVFNLGTTDLAMSRKDILVASEHDYVKNHFSGNYDHFELTWWAALGSNLSSHNGSPTVANYNTIGANVIFDNPGKGYIQLDETWQGKDNPKTGETVSTTKNVTVRTCPYLDCVSFGGEQRAFHRQLIIAHIAQNPKYPITEYSVKINGAYARTPVATYSDEFLDLSMEFLTKNSAGQNFEYEIFAKDIRGNTMNQKGIFYVAPDLAPKSLIKVNEPIYRTQNINGEFIATINAEFNAKLTDDPVTYNWALPKEADNISYSADGDKVSFTLNTPGYYDISLTCQDHYNSTLPELLNGDDYKTATYTYKFAVNNKKPLVSLNAYVPPNSLELLLINPGTCDIENVRSTLAENNIEAEIKTGSYTANSNPIGFGLVNNNSFTTPFSNYLKNATKLESCVLCDDNYVYKLVVTNTGTLNMCTAPYYIYRFDKDSPTQSPMIFKVPDNYLPEVSSGVNFATKTLFFSQDQTGQYITITLDNKTAIFNKKTANFITTNTALSSGNVAIGSYLYSATTAGLIKVNLNNGNYELALSPICLESKEHQNNSMKIIGDFAYFIIKDGNNLKLASLNLSNGQVSQIDLIDSATSVTTTDTIVAISSSGRFVIERKPKKNALMIDCFDISGNRIGSRITRVDKTSAEQVVYNSAGEINYVFETTVPSGTTKVITYLYDLKTGTSQSITCTAKKQPNRYYHLAGIEFDDSSVVTLLSGGFASGKQTEYSAAIAFGTGNATTFANSWGNSLSDEAKLETGYHNNGSFIFTYGNGDSSYSFLYELSKSKEDCIADIKSQLLKGDKDFQIVIDLSEEKLDLNSIIAECAPSSSGAADNTIRHFKVGDKVSYNFSYSDPEGDPKLSEHYSIDLSKPFTTAGIYNFDYYAIDNCNNANFNQKSNVLHITFVVGDIEKDPEPERSRALRLHRRY